jgi:hypothetical protein
MADIRVALNSSVQRNPGTTRKSTAPNVAYPVSGSWRIFTSNGERLNVERDQRLWRSLQPDNHEALDTRRR